MQKKRISAKVLSAVLSLLMILTAIPLVPFAMSADAAYANEYYHPAGTQYIKDIAMVYYKKSDEGQEAIKTAVGASAGTGYALLKDLTAGTGGDYYVYVGWRWTTDPSEAITGFRIHHGSGVPGSFTQSGVNWYPVNSGVHSWVPQLHGDGCVDLNKGAGGDDMTLYVTKDPAFGPPVTHLDRPGSTDELNQFASSGWIPVVTFEEGTAIDINKGAGGDTLYFAYYYDHSYTKVNTSALRSAYESTAQFIGKEGYTPSSIGNLATARNNAKTIMDEFDNNGGHGTYTQAQIDAAANAINNAANNLKTYLYLDGMTNGGTANQTIEVTVGRNSSASVNLGNYSATKAGADFVGWSKGSLEQTGTKGTVTVGFNETYYALFGVELTTNFHYLNTDGTYKVETKKMYAMNSAKTASTPKPTLKNANYDGRTFEFIGWREDTAATEATIGKTGIYTVHIENPVVDVYAVYSSDITFTQDVNKGTPAVDAQTQTQYLNANANITVTSHEFTVTDIAPEREGGQFLGWADSDNATAAQYTAGYKFTLTSDKTIYAAYKMDMWDVTFKGDNGEIIDVQKIRHGDDAVYPATIPTKNYDETNHYSFANWDKTVEEISNVKAPIVVNAVFTATEHEYTVTTNVAPDCLNEGEDHYECDCGYEKNVAVDALGHDIIFNPGHEATCTTAGSTDEKTCARCLEVLQEKEVIPALGHNYQLSEAREATCSVGGYEIWVCENNKNHKETRNITAPTGKHISKDVKAEAPSCLESGLTEGTECAECRAVLVAQNIILAEGHELITDKYVAPTCEDTGLTKGSHCANCDYTVAQEVIPALGHDWAKFEAKAATCTEAGYTAGSKCRRCHTVKDSIEIPALNHGENGFEVIEHDATCTEDAYTEYVCAYDAKHSYIVKGEETATGHTGGTATCTDKAVCDVCGTAYGKTIAHTYEAVVIPSTCVAKGYTEYTCSACGDTYTDNETPLAGHTYNDGVITVAPTCDTEGEKTFTCLYCTDSYTEAVAATGHTVDNWAIEENMAAGDCTGCGEHITANPEDVGLELPECEKCGMVHKYNSGIFKYDGIYCKIMAFFRQIANFFKGIA